MHLCGKYLFPHNDFSLSYFLNTANMFCVINDNGIIQFLDMKMISNCTENLSLEVIRSSKESKELPTYYRCIN